MSNITNIKRNKT